MAKYKPGPLATEISGTIGSCVFSAGRSGLILRKQQPHRSNKSPAQIIAQHQFGQASNSWRLLATQLKVAWDRAAASISSTNADPSVRISGFQLYLKMYGTFAAWPSWSSTVVPTAISSSPVLLIVPSAHYDVPELTVLLYGPGVSASSLVYFRCATNYTSYFPKNFRSWRWIGVGEYSSFPYDFIDGYKAAFGTPQAGQWCALQAITIEPGQAPSPSYVAPMLWHAS